MRLFEILGFIKPKLVKTIRKVVRWIDGDIDETITFFLWEYPSGKRFYTVNEYGWCETYTMHRKYLSPILEWVYGV